MELDSTAKTKRTTKFLSGPLNVAHGKKGGQLEPFLSEKYPLENLIRNGKCSIFQAYFSIGIGAKSRNFAYHT